MQHSVAIGAVDHSLKGAPETVPRGKKDHLRAEAQGNQLQERFSQGDHEEMINELI